jgi:hypothetical protein
MPDLDPQPPTDPGRRSLGWQRWLLAVLLAWAFGVRLWFARTGLDNSRFVDERFILNNVRSFLLTGSPRPVNLYYPGLGNLLHSLLLGAADALARWTGHGGETILHDGLFTPAAYFLSRGLQAVLGVLTLYWTYRLGRRLLSPGAGLLAALALAAVPLHVRQSAVIKPDILMLLGLLIAAEATAAALASGRWREFLGAGAAVGLATSGKYNGVAAALPLAFLALPAVRRRPAILARLAAAGAASLLTFVLINPFFFPMWAKFRHDFSYTVEHYQAMSHAGDSPPSHLGVLLATGPEMLSPNFHGVLTGVLGFAGLLAVVVLAWRRRDRNLALLAAFPLAYAGLYAASTTYAKTNNYLPVSPFLALGAAALIAAAWERLGAPANALMRRAFAAAVLVWCATLVWRPMAYAYDQTVPETLDAAEDALGQRLAILPGSRVIAQVGDLDRPVWVGDDGGRALVRSFDGAGQAPAASLDLADAEVYTPAALASPAAAARAAAAERAGQRMRIEPRLFQAHGEPLTLLFHPFTAVGDAVELAMQRPAAGGAWSASPPAGWAAGARFPALASFEVIVAVGVDPPEAVVVDGRRLPVYDGGRRGRRWLTERVLLDHPPAAVALAGVPADPADRADTKPPRLLLQLWAGR